MNNEDKKEIVELYNSGKTIYEVARITGIHKSSVWRVCKKAGIMRTLSEAKKGKPLSISHRENISKSLKSSEKRKSYHISQRKKLKEGHEKLTKELAYIAGVLITDGYIVTSRGIGLESIDKEFVDLFSTCCEKQFGISPNRYENAPRMMTDPRIDKQYQTKKRYLVRFGAVALEEFCKQINTDWIRKLPDELKLHALRGMWDGDGCYASGMYLKKGAKKKYKVCQVLFYNKDKDIICLYEELLRLLEVSGRYIKQSNGVLKYYFGRQAQIKKFFTTITPVIKRKKVKIDADLASWS